MTAHWIEVNDGKWKMRAAVIGFKAISGSHTGENLGRYTVGLLDRVGIMDKKKSKVRIYVVILIANDQSNQSNLLMSQLYTATFDNTGNNDTTCKAIQNIHRLRGLEWNRDEQQLP